MVQFYIVYADLDCLLLADNYMDIISKCDYNEKSNKLAFISILCS